MSANVHRDVPKRKTGTLCGKATIQIKKCGGIGIVFKESPVNDKVNWSTSNGCSNCGHHNVLMACKASKSSRVGYEERIWRQAFAYLD
jgi:hypothetical protein